MPYICVMTAEELKALRAEHGRTQLEIGILLGLPPKTAISRISEYEIGRRAITPIVGTAFRLTFEKLRAEYSASLVARLLEIGFWSDNANRNTYDPATWTRRVAREAYPDLFPSEYDLAFYEMELRVRFEQLLNEGKLTQIQAERAVLSLDAVFKPLQTGKTSSFLSDFSAYVSWLADGNKPLSKRGMTQLASTVPGNNGAFEIAKAYYSKLPLDKGWFDSDAI